MRRGGGKSILGSTPWQGHHFRIEVAVSHCHLVTFVRHCTFKPSFFSPSSCLHSLLPEPIVWIPPVTFYVAIWKLEGKRSSARDSLWNQLVDWLGIYFCLARPPHPTLFLISSPCLPRPLLCSRRNLFVVYLHSLIPDKDKADVSPSSGQFSLPVCKWNPLGALVDGCEKLKNLVERWPSLGEREAPMCHQCQDIANEAL